MTRPHAELVDRALDRVKDRRDLRAPQPDDVLGIEVLRLRVKLDEALGRGRGAAARVRLLDELRRERDAAVRDAEALRVELAEVRAQLADADARRTIGGRTAGYHAPKAWTNGTHAAPTSATDPAAPPLGRAATRPTTTGEEL